MEIFVMVHTDKEAPFFFYTALILKYKPTLTTHPVFTELCMYVIFMRPKNLHRNFSFKTKFLATGL